MTADSDSTLHPRWRQWVAENLARGAPIDEVVTALVEDDVPEALARVHVETIAASPGLAEARRLWHRVRAVEQIVRLRGEHRADFGAPIRRIPTPTPEEFRERYLAPGVPVIVTDLVTRWPAWKTWSPAMLAERYGDVRINACVGRSTHQRPDTEWAELKRMLPLRELIARIEDESTGNDVYAIAKNGLLQAPGLAPLLDDLALPEGIFGPHKVPQRMGLWIGGKGTHTPLHHDGDNSMFCQVYGAKRLRLAPPELLEPLDRSDGVYSAWDPAHPAVQEVEIAAGEALLIPSGWWHQVDALQVSITVTILEMAWPNDYGWYRPGTLLRGRGP